MINQTLGIQDPTKHKMNGPRIKFFAAGDERDEKKRFQNRK
jgi:hypothetical protein